MEILTIARHGRVSTPPKGLLKGRLPGAINLVYFDGHAKLLPLPQRWEQDWNRLRTRPPAGVE